MTSINIVDKQIKESRFEDKIHGFSSKLLFLINIIYFRHYFFQLLFF